MIKNKVKYIHVNNRKKIIILDSREDDSYHHVLCGYMVEVIQ